MMLLYWDRFDIFCDEKRGDMGWHNYCLAGNPHCD
jgi:hypothetical protein